jgi:callose synthase
MSFARKLRYVLKLVSAAAWVVILPVTYAYSGGSPTALTRIIKGWLGNGQDQSSLYIMAVLIYLAPNMLAAMLFIFPFIRRNLESSNLKVVTFMMWWSQVISSHCFVSLITWLCLLIHLSDYICSLGYLLAEECMKEHSPS